MKFTVTKESSFKSTKTLVVFATFSTKGKDSTEKKTVTLSGCGAELKAVVADAIKDEVITGTPKENVFFRDANVMGAQHLLVMGAGKTGKIHPEVFRNVMAIALRRLKANKLGKATILASSFKPLSKDWLEVSQAMVEGLILGNYSYDDFFTEKPPKDLEEVEFLVDSKTNPSSVKKALSAGEITSECINYARWMGDTPGNIMTPERMASEIQKRSKGTKLKVTSWDRARIKKERMGGLLGVALGGGTEPRFIIMEYKGAAASKKPICFVGKGLTFDSGGISIKPSASMEEMKYDVCGGANVIATMLAIAKLGLKVNVTAYVPSTENMPGPMANKPGDILTARNGKTVEVFNTDAEGRLILMDALAYASEQKPAAIFDAATLTGAILVALGSLYSGIFTRDEKLKKRIQKAADKSGELLWQMPLHDSHAKDIKGIHADLKNIGSGRMAGSSTAAAFLEQFVDKDIPWCHFDIAGTAWNSSKNLSYCQPKDASGAMIRTFIEIAKSY